MSFPWKNILRNVQNERSKTNFIVILNYSIVIYLWSGPKFCARNVCNITYEQEGKFYGKYREKK